MNIRSVPIIILVVLLIANGIYTYSMQNRLTQTEGKLKAFQDKILVDVDKMGDEVAGLSSDVDDLNSELYGKSKSSGSVWSPSRRPSSSRIDKLEEQLSGGYGTLGWKIYILEERVDSIKHALEQKGFRLSGFPL